MTCHPAYTTYSGPTWIARWAANRFLHLRAATRSTNCKHSAKQRSVASMPGPVSHVPFIPESAPFTAEQRAWLNGFLAGIYSSAEPAAEPLPALKIAVLYASQSGTAEGLARKVTKELTSKGHVVTFLPLEGYTPASLAAERYAVLVASTYGEGDPPDAVQPFYNQLCMEHFPRFENLS